MSPVNRVRNRRTTVAQTPACDCDQRDDPDIWHHASDCAWRRHVTRAAADDELPDSAGAPHPILRDVADLKAEAAQLVAAVRLLLPLAVLHFYQTPGSADRAEIQRRLTAALAALNRACARSRG